MTDSSEFVKLQKEKEDIPDVDLDDIDDLLSELTLTFNLKLEILNKNEQNQSEKDFEP